MMAAVASKRGDKLKVLYTAQSKQRERVSLVLLRARRLMLLQQRVSHSLGAWQ